jgi:hypothetical protein
LESSEWTLSGDAQTCDLVSVTNTRDRCNETAESHLSNNNNNNNYNKLIVRRVLCCFTTKGKKWQRNTSCTCHCDVPRHWPFNCFVMGSWQFVSSYIQLQWTTYTSLTSFNKNDYVTDRNVFCFHQTQTDSYLAMEALPEPQGVKIRKS